MKFSNVVERALGAMNIDTWGQGSLRPEEKKYCFIGHVYRAADLAIAFVGEKSRVNKNDCQRSILNALHDWDMVNARGWNSIAELNDDPEITVEDMRVHMKDLLEYAYDHDVELEG